MKPSKVKPEQFAPDMYYRPHTLDEAGPQRVWRSHWGGDMFKIMSPEEFAALAEVCVRMGFWLSRADEA